MKKISNGGHQLYGGSKNIKDILQDIVPSADVILIDGLSFLSPGPGGTYSLCSNILCYR